MRDEILVNLFQELNFSKFGGELPLPDDLSFTRQLKTCDGQFTFWRNGKTRIKISLDSHEYFGINETKDILLHEMCHFAEWFYSPGASSDGDTKENSPVFLRFIKLTGASLYGRPIPLSRSIKSDDEEELI